MATIGSGYDLFSVVKGSTLIDLGQIFPGAEVIYSDGVPIDPEQYGNFSTGIKRYGELPHGESGVIPIEMFAEHSVSIKPVSLKPYGLGDGYADFHTIINLGGILPNLPNTDGLVRPSTGVMAIHRSATGGGRFELMLNINPLIVLTKVGGSVADLESDDIIKVIDGSGLLNPVGSIGGQWSEAPPAARGLLQENLRAEGFFAATDRLSSEPSTVDLTSGGVRAQRQVQCAIRID